MIMAKVMALHIAMQYAHHHHYVFEKGKIKFFTMRQGYTQRSIYRVTVLWNAFLPASFFSLTFFHADSKEGKGLRERNG